MSASLEMTARCCGPFVYGRPVERKAAGESADFERFGAHAATIQPGIG